MGNLDSIFDFLKHKGKVVPKVFRSLDHHTGGSLVKVEEKPHDWDNTGDVIIDADYVFYPSVNHIEKFLKSQESGIIRKDGPASRYPGIVGIVYVVKGSLNGVKRFNVDIQSAFKVGDHVNRSLATKYAGWKNHLVKMILEDAQKEGVEHLMFNRRKGISVKGNILDPSELTESMFKSEASKFGFNVKNISKSRIVFERK
ncbi:Uncharacterised protein [uncultured archaeon]|nr:Uncharacterised protein [uncultured archaeon]